MPLADLFTQIDVNTSRLSRGKAPEHAQIPEGGSDYRNALSRTLAKDSQRTDRAPASDPKPRPATETKPSSFEQSSTPDVSEQREIDSGESSRRIDTENKPADASENSDETLDAVTNVDQTDTANNVETTEDLDRLDETIPGIVTVLPLEPVETNRTNRLTPPSGLQLGIGNQPTGDETQRVDAALSIGVEKKPTPPPSFLQTNVIDATTPTDDAQPALPETGAVAETAPQPQLPELTTGPIDVTPIVDDAVPIQHETQPQYDAASAEAAVATTETTTYQELPPVEVNGAADPTVVEASSIPSSDANTASETGVPVESDQPPRVDEANSNNTPSPEALGRVAAESQQTTPPPDSSAEDVDGQTLKPVEKPKAPAPRVADKQSDSAEPVNDEPNQDHSSRPEAAASSPNSEVSITTTVGTESGDGKKPIEAIEPQDRAGSDNAQNPIRVDSAQRATTTNPTARVSGETPIDLTTDESANRVAQMVQSSMQTGRPLRVRLTPPELGTLQIEVAVRSGTVTARIDVQTASARQIVLDNLSSLQETLVQNGSAVDHIEVHLSDFSAEEQPGDTSAGWDQQPDQDLSHDRPRDEPRNPREQREPENETPTGRTTAVQAADRLDVQI